MVILRKAMVCIVRKIRQGKNR